MNLDGLKNEFRDKINDIEEEIKRQVAERLASHDITLVRLLNL